MKFGKVAWCTAGLLALDCALRIAILAYWAAAPDSVPGIPMFYKGIRYPELQAGLLLVTVPAMAFIFWPPLRSPRRLLWLGRAWVVLGLALFVLSLFLSLNVVGSGVLYFALGQSLVQGSRSRGLQSS